MKNDAEGSLPAVFSVRNEVSNGDSCKNSVKHLFYETVRQRETKYKSQVFYFGACVSKAFSVSRENGASVDEFLLTISQYWLSLKSASLKIKIIESGGTLHLLSQL